MEDGIYFKNKEKAKGPLKDFLADWDTVIFDLHIGVLNEGGLDFFSRGRAGSHIKILAYKDI